MTARRPRGGGRTILLALAIGACGPYADLAQKLDVTARIAGDTWVAAAGADRQETRILIVGAPDADGVAPFAFTSIVAIAHPGGPTGNTSGLTLQGTWTEVGSAGDTTLHVAHTYTMPDETLNSNVLNRVGSQRDDAPQTLRLTVKREGGRLLVSGDARLAGTYVGLSDALARLGTASERDAACAYQIAALGIQSSEIRIIGFGGAGMLQYQHAATYIGTIAGSVRVSMSGYLHNTTTITYEGFADQGGITVSGPQVTDANSSGSGSMSGVVTFVLTPVSLDPAAVTTPVKGSIDYGSSGTYAVQITGGNTSGGYYVVSLDGGATTRVPAAAPPSPSAADCLDLP